MKQQKKQYQVSFDEKHHRLRFDPRKTVLRKQPSSWYYLASMGQIGFAVALPIAGGAFLGVYLDRQWSTYPKATLFFLFVGILVSLVSFIHTVQELIQT